MKALTLARFWVTLPQNRDFWRSEVKIIGKGGEESRTRMGPKMISEIKCGKGPQSGIESCGNSDFA